MRLRWIALCGAVSGWSVSYIVVNWTKEMTEDPNDQVSVAFAGSLLLAAVSLGIGLGGVLTNWTNSKNKKCRDRVTGVIRG